MMSIRKDRLSEVHRAVAQTHRIPLGAEINRIINNLSAQAQAAQVSIFCAVSVSMSTTHKLQ